MYDTATNVGVRGRTGSVRSAGERGGTPCPTPTTEMAEGAIGFLFQAFDAGNHQEPWIGHDTPHRAR